ncbi:Prostaglandin E synthase 2-like protein [Drosera capensis]
MKRAVGISTLRRAAIATSVVASTASSPAAAHNQRALYSGFASSTKSNWLWNIFSDQIKSPAVGGTLFFSVAASSLVQDARLAKEPARESAKEFPKNVVLYQYEACPFCNKVKAFLDYYSIPYKVVEVNPISKKEIKWSDDKKVPILSVDGEKLVNSSDIIATLFERIDAEKATGSSVDDDEEKEWLGWVDNHLVHVLSPNIYRSTGEALESFDYITTHGKCSFCWFRLFFAFFHGESRGEVCWSYSYVKQRHNITDERKALYDSAETWVYALKGRDFLGGTKPNLADLAVFGVLRPIRHLRSGKDMVDNTRIDQWYARMEEVVGESCRIKE